MGHLKHKYTRDYFLGGVDAVSGRPYGVLGHAEFKEKRIHERHLAEFAFLRSLTGGLAGKDILDIGCGRGDHIPLFLGDGVRSYHGIDFSPESISIAHEHVADPRVTLEVRDASELEEKEGYDVITLFDVVEHIPAFEMEVLWRKIGLMLRPGGVVFFSTPVFSNPNEADHTEQSLSVMGLHCHKQTMGTIARTCCRHGFIVANHHERCFGLLRRGDLPMIDAARRDGFLRSHRSVLAGLGLEPGDLSLTEKELRSLVPGAGRLLVGCVAENRPKFLSQALRLIQSVRWFGGSMAGVNVMVCIVDDADQTYVDELRKWGAFVRVVPRFSYFHPYSNKLRLLDLPEVFAYDTVVLMDCDTLVVQDPLPYIAGDRFQAKIADVRTVSPETFDVLFRHFGIEPPGQKYRCTYLGHPTVWYVNAGVLVFPREMISSLYPSWKRYTEDLTQRLDLLGERPKFCEQASLTLAYTETSRREPLPFAELPVSMNFPLHLTEPLLPDEMMSCDPVIIHYHHLVDSSGFISPTPYPGARRRTEEFNERLRQFRGQRFDNRTFWDLRYAEHPELGSGLGSRDLPLVYKRRILKQVIEEFRPASVLDVGCGDQFVTSDIPDDIYTGIDISPVIIAQNRQRHPGRTYIAGDFLEKGLPSFDFSLCLDVVIHLDRPEVYERLIQRLVTSTAGHGVISGYEEAPSAKSDITFFHEPLSLTLRRSRGANLRNLGKYRDTTVWCFSRDQREGGGIPADVLGELARLRAIEKSLSWRTTRAVLDVVDRGLGLPGARKTGGPDVSGVAEKAQAAAPAAAKLEKPVFIVGCMRSGTTLLANLLGRHRDIVYCPFELKEAWSKAGGVAMASPRTGDSVCLPLGAADVSEEVAGRLHRAFAAVYETHFVNKNEGARFLNKNPHLCNKLFFVDRIFGNARYIWIYRPLPDVVASLKMLFSQGLKRHKVWHYWPERKGDELRCWHCFYGERLPDHADPRRSFPGGSVEFLAEYWLEGNRAVAEFFRAAPAHRTLTVRQEDLVFRTGEIMTECEGFLGVPLDVSMLEGYPIDRDRNNRWAAILDPAEQSVLADFTERVAGGADDPFPQEGLLASYGALLRRVSAIAHEGDAHA